MKTDPIYLVDSYEKEIDAEVIAVMPESEGKWRVILDKTVFYPMGGGQATDQGTLVSDNWNGEVYMVMMKDGEINHYVKASFAPVIGMFVHGKTNWERRYLNMRKHSGGHIVDFAMYVLGYSPTILVPYKGDHDKKLYIVYTGNVGKDIQKELEDKSNELVAKNLQFTWEFKPLEEVEKEALYLQPGLPQNKPLRILHLEDIGSVADGGTQVHNTGEVGKIQIPSIEILDGATCVHYALI